MNHLSLKHICVAESAYSVELACKLCHSSSFVVRGQQSKVNTSVILLGLQVEKPNRRPALFVRYGFFWPLRKDIGLSCSFVPAFIWVTQILNHLGARLNTLRGNLFYCHFLICYCFIFHSLTEKVIRKKVPFIWTLVGALYLWGPEIVKYLTMSCSVICALTVFVFYCGCAVFSSGVAFVAADFWKSSKHTTPCSHAGRVSAKSFSAQGVCCVHLNENVQIQNYQLKKFLVEWNYPGFLFNWEG